MRSKKVIYNISTNLVLQVLVVLYGFIVPRVIIGSFGSEVNGLVSSITQFLAYITLLESGFGPVVKSALYKPIANKESNKIADILKTTEKFFRTVAFIFIAYIILLCLLYPLLVAQNFDFIFTVSLIIIIGISTFAEYYFGMTYRLFLQAEQKSYIISVIQIVTYILSTIVIIVLAKIGTTIQIIKLASGLIFVLRPLIQNYYVKKKYNINLKKASRKYELKQKWDGLAQHIAFVIHSNTDITVLTIFGTLIEVSVYSVYYLVVKGIKSLVTAITNGIDATFGDMIAKKEIDNLNKKFSMYEVIYNSINTIVCTCAIILIVPFISLYTKGITDANYIRPVFATLLIISEYIWAIRQPYNELIKASCHFKETRAGAWIECVSNILLSIILVRRFGIIGVAIGTIVAMTIRTIEFIYHTNKYILERSIWESIKKILLVIIETIIIVFVCKYIPFVDNINYINWIINAFMVIMVASIITMLLNFILFKKEFKNIIDLFNGLFRRKNRNNG